MMSEHHAQILGLREAGHRIFVTNAIDTHHLPHHA